MLLAKIDVGSFAAGPGSSRPETGNTSTAAPTTTPLPHLVSSLVCGYFLLRSCPQETEGVREP